MRLLSAVLVLLVVALHLAFMVLEMAFWDHDIGRRIFALTPEFSRASRIMAANQGIYNGVLAAGIGYALLTANRAMLLFLLASVVVVGVFGGYTVKPTIYLIQALPGALAFLTVWLAGRRQA